MSGQVSMPSVKAKAIVMGVDCPHCNDYIQGIVGDPRGEILTCEGCNKEFVIEEDLDLS